MMIFNYPSFAIQSQKAVTAYFSCKQYSINLLHSQANIYNVEIVKTLSN